MLDDSRQHNLCHSAGDEHGRRPAQPATILGDASQGGSYVLRIHVQEATSAIFGRFNAGKPIEIPAGEYVYVGSAMRGLARRLIRHATRSEHKRAQPIRDELIRYFGAIGLGQGELLPVRSKRLHWNVDHLLDNSRAELTHVFAIRSSISLEAELGKLLEKESCTFILESGLGASDVPGNTHLLGVHADESWWRALPVLLVSFYASCAGI